MYSQILSLPHLIFKQYRPKPQIFYIFAENVKENLELLTIIETAFLPKKARGETEIIIRKSWSGRPQGWEGKALFYKCSKRSSALRMAQSRSEKGKEKKQIKKLPQIVLRQLFCLLRGDKENLYTILM